MARLHDQVLVIDVESTCWEGEAPPGQSSEIIEIGVATIDVATLQRVDRESILIRPVRSTVSEFCTSLTTITPQMLQTAGTLEDALRILRKEYRSKERLWASWGDYDRRQFERVCAEAGAAYPFGHGHLNVKSLHALATGRREAGLGEAFAALGWTMEGTHHRGGDDAWNIAAILCEMLRGQRDRITRGAAERA